MIINKVLKILIVLKIVVTAICSHQQKCLINDQRDPSVYRLGQAILPQNYEISLIFKDDFYKTLTFIVEKCFIKISLNPNFTKNEVKIIRFHYNSTISKENVSLADKNGRNVEFNISNFDLCSQIIEVTLINENLEVEQQPYTLTFSNLVGQIRLDNFGAYLGQYSLAGVNKYLVATQFQAPKARFNFPCFDEPAMKATFDISITAPKSYSTIIGNTKIITQDDLPDIRYRKTTLNTTSKISTYLVAYVVSSFESASVKGNENFKVYYTEGRSGCAKYALELLPKIVEAMENIFGIKYSDMGNPQLNQVALPEFSAADMEYWGVDFYRESVLLNNPSFATELDHQTVVIYMGHAISHMWIGNYVTIDWWSHLWITEGSAKYFSYHATADVVTDKELKNQFVVDVVQEALEREVLYNLPLTSRDEEILNWKEISKKSTPLAGEKGASVIRMIEHIIGTANLKEAYRKFLQKYKWSNAKASNLIEAFEAEGLPRGIMREWTEEVGYPVVCVRKVDNTAELTQYRFLIQHFKSSTKWNIPITYSSEAHNKNFNATIPTHWLTPNKELILEDVFKDGIKWVIVNVQLTGFYRVNYEEALWLEILNALKSENFDGIPAINRAQIIDDVMNMARSMRQSYNLAMDFTKYLEKETDYYPWAAAYKAFQYLLIRIGKRKELSSLLKKYIMKLSENLWHSKSYLPQQSDSHIEILKKVLHIEWACECGNEKCIKDFKMQFSLYKAGPQNFNYNSNLRYALFCNAIRYGTAADWNFLYEQYKLSTVPTERKKILEALGCATDPSVLMKFLEMSIASNSTIRKHDCYKVFRAVVKTNVDIAYEFLKIYVVDISYKFGSYNALTIILELLIKRFSTIAEIQDFKRFIEDNHNLFHEADGGVVEGFVKTAESNVKWLTTFEDELTDWLTREINKSNENRCNFALYVFICILVIIIY